MKNKKLIYGILVVVILAIAGIGLLVYQTIFIPTEEKITSFEECAKAGYPVLESYPRQCETPDGKIFVEKVTHLPNPASVYCKEQGGELEIRKDKEGNEWGFCIFLDGSECEEWEFFRGECKKGERFCKDLCGDGIYQEVVCMEVGCPCPETPATCPDDCKRETGTDKESCEALGGKWQIWRNIPNASPECNLPTSDAGKPCLDSSECESYCEAPEGAEVGAEVEGRCYGYQIAICMQEVRNGIAKPEWCY